MGSLKAFLGSIGLLFGCWDVSKKLYTYTDNFNFVRYLFSDFLTVYFLIVIFMLFWTYQDIFGARVGPEIFWAFSMQTDNFHFVWGGVGKV